MVLDDLVGNRAGWNLAGPPYQLWNAKCALPICVLLAAEGGHRPVGPSVHVRAVVGAVHDEGIFGDAQLVQSIQHLTNILVMVDHGVMVRRLVFASLSEAAGLG